ncbi:hypothetical protein GCM10018987_30730 [Streptomyces cremeus]
MPQAAEDDPVEELDEDDDVDDEAAGFESEPDEPDEDGDAVFAADDDAGELLDEEPRLSFR